MIMGANIIPIETFLELLREELDRPRLHWPSGFFSWSPSTSEEKTNRVCAAVASALYKMEYLPIPQYWVPCGKQGKPRKRFLDYLVLKDDCAFGWVEIDTTKFTASEIKDRVALDKAWLLAGKIPGVSWHICVITCKDTKEWTRRKKQWAGFWQNPPVTLLLIGLIKTNHAGGELQCSPVSPGSAAVN